MSTNISEVRAASIIRAMEAAHTSETSVDIQLRTWQYIPEDSELHTRRHDNLKSHKALYVYRRFICRLPYYEFLQVFDFIIVTILENRVLW
jgi:hypothetical protein